MPLRRKSGDRASSALSLSSAEGFASGAVGLLTALGAEYLSFGSETGELEPLEQVAQCIMDPLFQDSVKAILQQDATLSYAMAAPVVLEASWAIQQS